MRKQMGAGGIREEKRRAERRARLPATDEVEPTARFAIVLYDFKGQEDGDLSLKEGETVTLLETSGLWWRGHLQGSPPGTAGVFPHNYVQELDGLVRRPPPPGRGRPRGVAGPQAEFDAQLKGSVMADRCCRLLRRIVFTAVALGVGMLVCAAWTISSRSISQLPLQFFQLRYGELDDKRRPVVTTWEGAPTKMQGVFTHMYNSTPVVIRQGYPIAADELSWVQDKAQLADRLGGMNANITVEARPKGSKHFAFGSVEYVDITVQDFLRRRGGDELAGIAPGELDRLKEMYLVQHPLAVASPLWFDEGSMTIESTNLWMSGNADGGEVSTCHFDMSDNLLVVVEGQKTLTLIPPGDTGLLYPFQPADGLGAFESAYSSIIDLSIAASSPGAPDAERVHAAYPRLARARRFTVTLNPGDVLLIPRLWWHQVANLAGKPSTSINFWFRNAYSYSDRIAREMIRLNYDLYLEKRAQTLSYSRAKRFLDELSRLLFGPEPVPPMNVVYSHNPDDLEGSNGVQRFEQPGSGEVAVPSNAERSCERKGWLFAYEEMGPRTVDSESSTGSTEFHWDNGGGAVTVSTKQNIPQESNLNTRRRQQLKESLGRGDSLWEDGRFDAALVHYQRAVNVAPDHFEPRWKCSQVLISLNRLEPAMRQLRCAVPAVPTEKLQEFFNRYLLTLYRLEADTSVVREQVLQVAQRYVPLVPPWMNANQLTQGPYLPAAEDGAPEPFHDEWCASTGLCNSVAEQVYAITEELEQIIEKAQESEHGMADIFPPSPHLLASGGDLTLYDQAASRLNSTACAIAPQACSVVRQIPLLFQKFENPRSTHGWSGVPATVAIRHVKGWTREHVQIRQQTNDVLTMIIPLIIPRNHSQPKPWIRLGHERRLMNVGEPVLFDPSFILSSFFPMKRSAFLLVLNFWKAPLCAMRRCALSAEELLPIALRDEYTDHGEIPVIDWALGRVQSAADDLEAAADLGHSDSSAVLWTKETISAHLEAFTAAAIYHRSYNAHVDLWSERCNAQNMEPGGMWNSFQVDTAPSASVSLHGRLPEAVPPEVYPGADLLHILAFAKYPVIRGASVAVIGSVTPWIEAIVHNHGAARVTTVEHNVPQCDDIRFQTVHVDLFNHKDSKELFDVIVTYSSVEHAGLGRYGDPLDPAGDLKAMAAIRAALKPNGTVFWGAPVGQDGLMWNAMRIYGR